MSTTNYNVIGAAISGVAYCTTIYFEGLPHARFVKKPIDVHRGIDGHDTYYITEAVLNLDCRHEEFLSFLTDLEYLIRERM
jgi:hypothetical protein